MTEEKEKNLIGEQTRISRNGLLELYRFLFSMWVVYYHGFFVFKNQWFSHGYIAVEFFFILSGFYFIKSMNKFDGQSLIPSIGKMLWKRTKSLGLALVVGLIFVFWFDIAVKQISILGYLWYIPCMFLAFIVLFIVKRLIKNDKWFMALLAFFIVISYVLLYIPILEGWGIFRALGGVSLGVLISYIPKFNLKVKKFDFNWIIVFVVLGLVVYLAYMPKPDFVSEYILIFLLMPVLIYFSSTLTVKSRLLNFLGSLSFGLYAYQCVLRILELYTSLSQHWLFIILVGLVLVDRLIVFLYRKVKKKRNFVNQ